MFGVGLDGVDGGAVDVLGEQGFEILEGVGQGVALKEGLEVAVGLKAIGLGGFDEAVEESAGPGPCMGSPETLFTGQFSKKGKPSCAK